MKAVIFGSTGLVGKHLLAHLLLDDTFTSVINFVRTPTGADQPKLDVRPAPANWADVEAEECDVAFCCLGTTKKKAGSLAAQRKVDVDLVLEFANWCKKSGTPAFAVVSSASADPKSMFAYARMKGDMEQGLVDLDFTSLTIYRPGLLLGARDESRLAEDIGQSLFKLINPSGKSGRLVTSAHDLGALMASEAKQEHTGTQIQETTDIARLTR